MNYRKLRIAFSVISLIVLGRSPCLGQTVIFQHVGSVMPAYEGWSPSIPAIESANTGPINDGGTPAWFIADNFPVDNTPYASPFAFTYRGFLSASQAATASSQGWSLKVKMRTLNSPYVPPNGLPFADFQTNGRSFAMAFANQPDGDPIVVLPGFPAPLFDQTYVLEGDGPGYHMYELIYDPSSNSADLFVDGVERLSNYTGRPGIVPDPLVFWGARHGAGQGNFNLVQFAIVPEPSAVALFTVLVLLCGTTVWRRRR
jgi:hypothetical protein